MATGMQSTCHLESLNAKSMKHRIKKLLRKTVAKVAHYTRLRVVFRASRRGAPVLMFHNVGHPETTAYLPDHMKISEATLERLLDLLEAGGYETITQTQLVETLDAGETPKKQVVLTFDDGYRDNHDLLLPILKRRGATATIFVQTGPMKGKLNWLHHYFWVLHREGPHKLATLISEQLSRPHLRADLADLPNGLVEAEYAMKQLLKYEVAAEERDQILERIFSEQGGNDGELARDVYLSPDECRALDEAGIEIGAHTVNHLILSSLDSTRQRLEIEGSLRDLESWLGHGIPAFAYPYGRNWDFNEETLGILDDLGFSSAITAMPGLNDPQTPRMQLRRIAVNQESDLADVMCEVDGVFDWFERRGLKLHV
ncbi:MAG: peptidoglycan/xylan/chitin deacetylase (PgdA/CDA1 family) [Pseudohongiellaceae bacterium]|jgi:peptidoglycan/xylan/chitin deacetylase (PgdA/CDA1 family)